MLVVPVLRTAIKRILICTGGGTYIDNAVRFTSKIAKDLCAEVTLLTVIPQPPAMHGRLFRRQEDMTALLNSNSALARNLRTEKEIIERAGVPAIVQIRHGIVIEQIVKEVELRDYDLVVSGSWPVRDAWRNYAIGNVTREIVNRTDRPVLVIRSDVTPAPLAQRLRNMVKRLGGGTEITWHGYWPVKDAFREYSLPKKTVLAAAVLCAIASLSTLAFILINGVNVPFADEWWYASLVKSVLSGQATFDRFWSANNEHRMLIPRLEFSSLAAVTHWDSKLMMIANWLVAVVAMLFLLSQFKRIYPRTHPTLWIAAVAVSALALFSLVQLENWFWAFQFAFFFIQLAVIASLVVLTRSNIALWFRLFAAAASRCGGQLFVSPRTSDLARADFLVFPDQ